MLHGKGELTLISQEIWQNLLLWNRFRTTFGDEKFYFEYNVLVETTQLGVFSLNPKRKQRLELIYDLHLQGWSNKQITDHLNSKNLKTLRTKKQYTTKLIWMTIHKFKNRLSRKSDRILRIKESINVSLPMEKIQELIKKSKK